MIVDSVTKEAPGEIISEKIIGVSVGSTETQAWLILSNENISIIRICFKDVGCNLPMRLK